MHMKNHIFILALFIFLFAQNNSAWAITCSSTGLTYNPATRTCVGQKNSTPRYQGRGNRYCTSNRPTPKNISGFKTANNSREPYMRNEIYQYVQALKNSNRCENLVIQSTYRDCIANSNARGMQKSRHLCGGAADTSGCGGRRGKTIAQEICKQNGLYFINEGPSRFPHCQIQGSCN